MSTSWWCSRRYQDHSSVCIWSKTICRPVWNVKCIIEFHWIKSRMVHKIYLGVVPATGFTSDLRTTNTVMHENSSQKNIKRHHWFFKHTQAGIIHKPINVINWNNQQIHYAQIVIEILITFLKYAIDKILRNMIDSGVFSIRRAQLGQLSMWPVKWWPFQRALHRDLYAFHAIADVPTYVMKECLLLRFSTDSQMLLSISSYWEMHSTYRIFSSAVNSSKLCKWIKKHGIDGITQHLHSKNQSFLTLFASTGKWRSMLNIF